MGIQKRIRATKLGIAAALGLVGLIFPGGEASAAERFPEVAPHVPGEILIKLQDANRARVAAAIEALERRLGRSSVVGSRDLRTDDTLHVIRIARDAEMAEALKALKADPAIEIAEPNFLYRISAADLPNDPELAKTWGLRNTGQADAAGQVGKAGSDINVLPLWQAGIRGSRSLVVAVIDTGIDWEHPDLQANLYANPGESGEKAANGKDDDGNGFVDDVHGWNFNKKTNNSRDDHDHGTHCAGTIGGVGDNGIGVVGVNWEVSLLPIKFLDANGSGSLDAAIESVNYATRMKVDVMSNSWGGGGYSEALKLAIEKARDAGILFVAAAGNDGVSNDSTPKYPASYAVENVLSVAAIDNKDAIAGFSNYGTRSVHVAAPGVKVYSTTKGGKYDYMSGTSMATPHVAGISALMLSADRSLGFRQLKERLISTSVPVRGLKRKVMAKGRVSAYNAIHNIVPVSEEPDAALWQAENQVVESDHPYRNHDDKAFTVARPGAKYLRVRFEKIEVENGYDKVLISNGPAGESVDSLTGTHSNVVSEYVEGDTLVIRLKADESNVGFGFKVDQVEVIY